ncbi:MAG: IS630 transposase-related protein [Candidatus Accumulibacter sp.]|nr:IS630 transposase-related protein [Accumulibacter sp.]
MKEVSGIYDSSCYKWRKNKRVTCFCASGSEKRARRREIDPEESESPVEEKPDAYLRELAERFGCSTAAVRKRLR